MSKTSIEWATDSWNQWARNTIFQCRDAGVSPFVKQLGAKPVRLKDRKGEDPAEWPEDLRVREIPT